MLGVVAKDPIASKQNTTSAKVLNNILSETKNRVRNTTPDRSQQSFNTYQNSQSNSNSNNNYRRPLKHNNSASNLQDSSTNISKHKIIDCDNIGGRKDSDHKVTPNLRDSSTEGRKTNTPLSSKSGLRFFRNPSQSSQNHMQMKQHYSDNNSKGSTKSGSMDRPANSSITQHSPLLK